MKSQQIFIQIRPRERAQRTWSGRSSLLSSSTCHWRPTAWRREAGGPGLPSGALVPCAWQSRGRDLAVTCTSPLPPPTHTLPPAWGHVPSVVPPHMPVSRTFSAHKALVRRAGPWLQGPAATCLRHHAGHPLEPYRRPWPRSHLTDEGTKARRGV